MHFTINVHTILGLIGVAITLVAYGLLQTTKLSATSKIYNALNIIGSLLILYSLCFDWNVSAFVMESVWLIFSLYGLCRTTQSHSHKSSPVSS